MTFTDENHQIFIKKHNIKPIDKIIKFERHHFQIA